MKTTRQYGRKADSALSMWVKLARASATFAKLTARDIEQYGLTPPQFAVLESLGHLGPLTAGELGKKILVTGGCITVILDNLERDRLVERIRNAEDRRSYNVRLTHKGARLFTRIFRQHADRVAEFASVLSDEEQSQLSVLLKKLGTRLHNSYIRKS